MITPLLLGRAKGRPYWKQSTTSLSLTISSMGVPTAALSLWWATAWASSSASSGENRPVPAKKARAGASPAWAWPAWAPGDHPADVVDGAGAGGQVRVHPPLLGHEIAQPGAGGHVHPFPVQGLVPVQQLPLLRGDIVQISLLHAF